MNGYIEWLNGSQQSFAISYRIGVFLQLSIDKTLV